MNKQNGFSHIVLLVLAVVISIAGFAGWRVWQQSDGVDDDLLSITETGDFKRQDDRLFGDKVNIHNLEVIKLPDGRLRAFFHEGPGNVKSAISSDEGKTFELEDGVRVQGSVPATVQLNDGRWRMYYSRQGDLFSAISTDGFNFTPEAGVRLVKGVTGDMDAYGLTHPSIVQLPDGGFRMYYDGQFKPDQGPHWRIVSASSRDGLTWIKDAGVRIPVDTGFGDYEAGLSFSCHVELKNGQYVMYFSSEGNPMPGSGIWRATSSDGINFSVEASPVLGRDSEFGNQADEQTTGGPKGVPQDPYLIQTSQGDRLFYWTSDKGYQSALRP